jgi:L-ascorbate metabolism protein UlaG (beta-lactamase superfamily)
MTDKPKLMYYGWSFFSVETGQGVLLFDPFFRPECGAEWAHLDDFARTNIICLTHGHHEHYLDTPVVAKKTGATVVAPSEICDHLKSRYGISPSQLKPIDLGQTVELRGFRITAFEWRHRTINLWKAFFGGGVLHGLNFVYNGMMKSPFSARKFGYHVKTPDGTTIMNYCEGLNNNMVVQEVQELGQTHQTDILLAGYQLNFEEHVGLGVKALAPKKAVLFHPHEKLFAKIGVPTSPVDRFVERIKQSSPGTEIIMSRPGTQVVY